MGQGDKKNDEPDTVTAYFSALNPIAQKIHQDIDRTRTTYEHVWHALNHHQQGDLINETLIRPEITLRYFNSLSASLSATSTTFSAISNEDRGGDDDESLHKLLLGGAADNITDHKTDGATNRIYAYDGRNLRTFQTQRTGQKMVHDETIGMFRDEHSGPFSFKTKSQLNLNLFPPSTTAPAPGVTTSGLQQSGETAAAMIKSIVNYGKPKSTPPTQKYQKIDKKDDVTTKQTTATAASDDSKADFLQIFICKDNLVFNAANTTATTDATDSTDDPLDGERRGLIESSSANRPGGALMQQDSSSTSLQSDDDYEKAAYCGEESTRLLNSSAYEMHKGFEFLSNW